MYYLLYFASAYGHSTAATLPTPMSGKYQNQRTWWLPATFKNYNMHFFSFMTRPCHLLSLVQHTIWHTTRQVQTLVPSFSLTHFTYILDFSLSVCSESIGT